jgi:hypothetical protein
MAAAVRGRRMKSKCSSRTAMLLYSAAAAALFTFPFAFGFEVEPTIEHVDPGTVTVVILWL